MKSTIWFWLIAIAITLSAAIYQRKTGPTYPKKVNVQVDDQQLSLKLARSFETDSTLEIVIPGISFEWSVNLYYRRFPTNEEWIVMPFMINEKGEMVAHLPSNQPKAGKLEYYIELSNPITDKTIRIPGDEPVVIRFKGNVPNWVIIPHVIIIFLSMLFSNLAGVMAIFKHQKFRFYGILTLIFMLVGGMIFGPIMQKFAFDAYWTGFPFGSDLTDNKTLIAFVFWIIAVMANYKKERPWASILAALVTLIIFSIPHSMRGSEFNYETGEIVTGFINNYPLIFGR